jgi:hypothetical protein
VLAKTFGLMHRLVGSPPLDLPIENWSELHEHTVAFRPDLVLELGRGYGNSTCVFTRPRKQSAAASSVSASTPSARGRPNRATPRASRRGELVCAAHCVQDDITTLDFSTAAGRE